MEQEAAGAAETTIALSLPGPPVIGWIVRESGLVADMHHAQARRLRYATLITAGLAASCGQMLGFDDVTFAPPAGDSGGADGNDAGSPGDGSPNDSSGGDSGASGAQDGDALPDDHGESQDTAPPFACEPISTSSPVLDGLVAFDPADPHPGDTVTVIVKSNTLDRPDAPSMELHETSASGQRVWNVQHMAGGKALYYYAVSGVEAGDHCLVGRIAGQDEISLRFTVTPRPAGPPRCGGVYKVTSNHQWTCDEQPDWGNEVLIRVRDSSGQPVSGATIRLDWPATTVRPIYNDTDPPAPSEVPATVQTDSSGVFHGFNSWPINAVGYMVFNVSVDGCASDVATEITTGWWETTNDGCKYCPMALRNVWGHWSHTVEFELDPTATTACVVPSDHAGQSACTPEHIHHDPAVQSCWATP